MLPHGERFVNDLLLDLRQWLNTLIGIGHTAEEPGQDFPEDAHALLTKWRATMEVWLTKLSEVGGTIRRAQGADLDWDDLMIQIGKILEGTSELKDEALQLALPATQGTRDLVDDIQRAATELQKFRRMIETQQYKGHWASYTHLKDD